MVSRGLGLLRIAVTARIHRRHAPSARPCAAIDPAAASSSEVCKAQVQSFFQSPDQNVIAVLLVRQESALFTRIIENK